MEQQIKRLLYENISYERELKRYRKGFREILDVNDISSNNIIQIKTTNQGFKYFKPDDEIDGTNNEFAELFCTRRSSLPSSYRKESRLGKVDSSFKNTNKLLIRYADLK